MAVVEIRHTPLGIPSPSHSSLLAATHQVLHQMPGIRHTVTPTSTILEGDVQQCLAAAHHMHQLGFQYGVPRMLTSIFIDERVDKPMSAAAMVAEVEQPATATAGTANTPHAF